MTMRTTPSIATEPNAPLVVAIMNDRLDFKRVRDERWYRIPVTSQRKWLASRWPPRWLAFYQTKIFGAEKYAVRYYAPVVGVRRALGYELLPSRSKHSEKGQKAYYKMLLGALQMRPQPIPSLKRRRILFIPTTLHKFLTAQEINDLYDDSPLENTMWAAMKSAGIRAERQHHIKVAGSNYILDFAIECAKGSIDVETDGDSYHANVEKAVVDNLRNNDLAEHGWKVLRFSTMQVNEQMESYCIPKIAATIDNLGGLKQGKELPRLINLPEEGKPHQPSLFD